MKMSHLILALLIVLAIAGFVRPEIGVLGGLLLAPVCATGLTAPTEAATGFPFAELTKIFRKRCRVYFSTGKFSGSSDDNYPEAKADVLGLIDPSTGIFMPLGKMDESIGKIGFKRNNQKTDFHTLPTDVNSTLELNSLRVYPDMVDWLDTDEAKGELTLLFIPDGDDGSIFLSLNGVGLTPEGEINLDGQLAKIKFTTEKQSNNITDVLLYEVFSS